MVFHETALKGAFVIEVEIHADERGSFGRSYCWREFQEYGLDPRVVQCNVSYNAKRGTLRGMHYQDMPHEEAKLIRCARGAMYDVIVDLRPASSTFRKWAAFELKAELGKSSRMVYVPRGFAHGFLTLQDDTEVFYQMSEFFVPEAARGFRWNDSAFDIQWPEPVIAISDRDRGYPDFVVNAATIES
jgi:dTDP-4-dehydrorhamnose 3,5-epimerase